MLLLNQKCLRVWGFEGSEQERQTKGLLCKPLQIKNTLQRHAFRLRISAGIFPKIFPLYLERIQVGNNTCLLLKRFKKQWGSFMEPDNWNSSSFLPEPRHFQLDVNVAELLPLWQAAYIQQCSLLEGATVRHGKFVLDILWLVQMRLSEFSAEPRLPDSWSWDLSVKSSL